MGSKHPPRAAAKPASKRAIVKDPLLCCADKARAVAPCGEYEIETIEPSGAACHIGLCSCATQNRFTLSFDAFLQH
ncbi:MAG TPA: hypothetical protein PKH09_04030, partial [Parvularculaceae bacterium]|nr:hypothetical protein [Parvularculaceae bacterium]